MSKVDEYIKKKSQKSKEWQKIFELEYKKLSDSLKKDTYNLNKPSKADNQ